MSPTGVNCQGKSDKDVFRLPGYKHEHQLTLFKLLELLLLLSQIKLGGP